MRYSSPGPSRNDTSGTYGASQSNQQSRPDYSNSGSSRMMEDTPAASDPSAARIALAGRPKVTDPNVQNALYIGELDWWVSDDDIRKIAQDVGIPISLSDVTFSEHKVNGKSKGVAYVEMSSEEEARALKTWFENNDINFKRAVVNLTTSANGNPFRTLPKDPPPRENRPPRGGMRGGGAGGQSHGGSSRGGRSDAPIPMAGAPIRMGSSTNGGGMNPMMNPMMMGMMGGGGGRPPFGGQANPMFMGANFGGQGGGMGRGGYGRGGGGRPPNAGMGHFVSRLDGSRNEPLLTGYCIARTPISLVCKVKVAWEAAVMEEEEEEGEEAAVGGKTKIEIERGTEQTTTTTEWGVAADSEECTEY